MSTHKIDSVRLLGGAMDKLKLPVAQAASNTSGALSISADGRKVNVGLGSSAQEVSLESPLRFLFGGYPGYGNTNETSNFSSLTHTTTNDAENYTSSGPSINSSFATYTANKTNADVTVKAAGRYRITAAGASYPLDGGDHVAGCKGARASGIFQLPANSVLTLILGGRAYTGHAGGVAAVARKQGGVLTPLIVAPGCPQPQLSGTWIDTYSYTNPNVNLNMSGAGDMANAVQVAYSAALKSAWAGLDSTHGMMCGSGWSGAPAAMPPGVVSINMQATAWSQGQGLSSYVASGNTTLGACMWSTACYQGDIGHKTIAGKTLRLEVPSISAGYTSGRPGLYARDLTTGHCTQVGIPVPPSTYVATIGTERSAALVTAEENADRFRSNMRSKASDRLLSPVVLIEYLGP